MDGFISYLTCPSHPLTHSPTHPIHSLTHSPAHPLTHPSIHLLTHSPTHPLIRPPIHPLTITRPPIHLPTHSITHLEVVFKVAEFPWCVLRVNILQISLKHSLFLPFQFYLAHGIVPRWTTRYVQYRPRLIYLLHTHLQLNLGGE